MKALFVGILIYASTAIHLVKGQCQTARVVVDFYETSTGFISNDKDDNGNYFNNENCLWAFALDSYQTLTFWFEKLDMEPSAACRNDFVEIYDGVDRERDVLTRQCSEAVVDGRNFTAKGPNVFVLFKTNNRIQRKGFKLSWLRNGGAKAAAPSKARIMANQRVITTSTTSTTTTTTTTSLVEVCDYIRPVQIASLRELSGVIESDNFGNSYANNQHCGWALNTPEGYAIRYRVLEADLEASCADYVTIHDGPDEDSPMIAKICYGNFSRDQTFNTTNHQGLVVFRSDASVSGRGFKLQWDAFTKASASVPWRQSQLSLDDVYNPHSSSISAANVPETTTPSVMAELFMQAIANALRCALTRPINADFALTEGIIENDKDTDGNYYNNDNCTWLIGIPPGMALRFSFQMVAFSSCSDFVAVYDGPTVADRVLTRQCSTYSGPTTEDFNSSPGIGAVLVQFYTDDSMVSQGFKMKWQLVPAEFTTTPPSSDRSLLASGQSNRPRCQFEKVIPVMSSLAPRRGFIENQRLFYGKYPSNDNSCWKIMATPGSIIELKFTTVDLEFSDDCSYDSVTIYDGPTVDDSIITRQCHRGDLYRKFKTTRNMALIQFRSDSSTEGRGFQMEWQIKQQNNFG